MSRARATVAYPLLLALVVTLILLPVVAAGCREADSRPGAGGPSGDGKLVPVDLLTCPGPIVEIYEGMKGLEVAVSTILGDETFFLAGMAWQDKAGASIELTALEVAGDSAVVTVQAVPGSGATTGRYAPVVIASTKGQFPRVTFKTADFFYPQLSEIKGSLKPVAESPCIRVTSIDQSGRTLNVKGVASVWEAQIDWWVKDAGGNVASKGYVLTSCGAWNWGWFEITTDLPVGADRIELFTTSAVDSSPLGVVTLPVAVGP